MSVTSKLTVAMLRDKAKAYEASVRGGELGCYARYVVDAPYRKLWAASLTHGLVVTWQSGDGADKQDAIKDALDRMEYGLTECDEAECDTCEPADLSDPYGFDEE